ncbi:MAG: FAD-dependent monooxygenase, partial [Bacteroidota bacterium]
MKKITIIGAGIGGLTTAIALEQKGYEVHLFEAFAKMKRLGAGIVLANNAMQVYRRLGLQSIIEKAGNRIDALKVVDENLEVMTQVQVKQFKQKIGVNYVAIHRGDLQEVLLRQLKRTQLHLGKRLQNVEENEDGVYLSFEDGGTHRCDALLAADGIHSRVREQLFPASTVRSAGQTCWRGVAKITLPQPYAHVVSESWGMGTRFGLVPLQHKECYWFAVANYRTDFRKDFADKKLTDILTDYHPLVHEVIRATPADQILLNELNDLAPMSRWHTNRVCLVGDAAHATTPNMGQGACQAIEDALAISICLEQSTDLAKAFKQFQSLRMKKANDIIRQSWQIGKLAHLPKGFKRNMRNAVLRLTPEW